MVTMVHNVTTDMGHVSCYADNGYGTPMQASRRITISSKIMLVVLALVVLVVVVLILLK